LRDVDDRRFGLRAGADALRDVADRATAARLRRRGGGLRLRLRLRLRGDALARGGRGADGGAAC